jgi:hypothetical protein
MAAKEKAPAPSPPPTKAAIAQAGVAHRVARRRANGHLARAASPSTDAQGLVEFACECMSDDCDRSVRVPLYVYRRLSESDQYLVQAGHHAFPRYRTIVQSGLMRIEEPLTDLGSEDDGTTTTTRLAPRSRSTST